jgi:hypothetical protein
MKNDFFLPPETILPHTQESDEYLAELREKVYTFWREHFGCGMKQVMELYDSNVSYTRERELPSFYALDSHFCEKTQQAIVTVIHVIDQTKPLTSENLTLIRQILRHSYKAS